MPRGKRAPSPQHSRDASSSDEDAGGRVLWRERNKRRCVKGNWDTGADISLSEEEELLCTRSVSVKNEPISEPYLIKPSLRPPKPKSRKEKRTGEILTVGNALEMYTASPPPRTALDIPVLGPTNQQPGCSEDSEQGSDITPSSKIWIPSSHIKHGKVIDIPCIGLSTYKVRNQGQVTTALDAALNCGYRLFDTGASYGNERELGNAFRDTLHKHGLSREDIYIVSKIDPGCVTYEDALECVENTLHNLQTDYVDIMLLYWPSHKHLNGMRPEQAMIECYSALETLYHEGKIKDIGCYRFGTRELTYLLEQCKVVPAMLQAEFHPYNYQRDLVDICRKNHIRMQAFCFIKCVEDPVIQYLARKYRKAPSQIVLKWVIQHGVGVLPKSKSPPHIRENADIFQFSLTIEDMESIDDLNRNTRFTPHPAARQLQ